MPKSKKRKGVRRDEAGILYPLLACESCGSVVNVVWEPCPDHDGEYHLFCWARCLPRFRFDVRERDFFSLQVSLSRLRARRYSSG